MLAINSSTPPRRYIISPPFTPPTSETTLIPPPQSLGRSQGPITGPKESRLDSGNGLRWRLTSCRWPTASMNMPGSRSAIAYEPTSVSSIPMFKQFS